MLYPCDKIKEKAGLKENGNINEKLQDYKTTKKVFIHINHTNMHTLTHAPSGTASAE